MIDADGNYYLCKSLYIVNRQAANHEKMRCTLVYAVERSCPTAIVILSCLIEKLSTMCKVENMSLAKKGLHRVDR